MKKLLCAVLPLLLLLCGCQSEPKLKQPVRFHYPNAQISYGTETGLIGSEQREGSDMDTAQLLNVYLQGPSDLELTNPFPKGTSLISLSQQGTTLTLTLSNRYADLSGIDLSLANACLAKTAMELTGAREVVIRCESKPLDGDDSVRLTADTLILYDESKTHSAADPTETTGK